MNVATKINPSREELKEAARNALEYGFPDVIKQILSRGFSYVLFDGDKGKNKKSATTRADCGTIQADHGTIQSDCGVVRANGSKGLATYVLIRWQSHINFKKVLEP